VQGIVEPGNVGVVKLGPTVQCTPSNYDHARLESLPCFLHEIVNAAPQQVHFSAIHSEEGERFYHDQRRWLVVEVEKDAELHFPENYLWMTLNQIKHLIQDYNCFNIEARALIACLRVNG
jgi:oxidase EvaA